MADSNKKLRHYITRHRRNFNRPLTPIQNTSDFQITFYEFKSKNSITRRGKCEQPRISSSNTQHSPLWAPTIPRYWTWATPTQSTSSHPTTLTSSTLLFCYRLSFDLPNGLFPQRFQSKSFYVFSSCLMYATCPVHLIRVVYDNPNNICLNRLTT